MFNFSNDTTLNTSTSDISSILDSSDGVYVKLPSIKRHRSPTPTSPVFSPLKPKKRKSRDATMNNSTETTEMEDIELKDSIFAQIEGIILGRSKNPNTKLQLMALLEPLWKVKCQSIVDEKSLKNYPLDDDTFNSSVTSVQRLSQRIRNPVSKKTIEMSQILHTQKSLEKVKKPTGLINRPIDEVIEDIFELDDKYLFRGLAREPVCKYCLKPGVDLQKCSGSCNYFFHSTCIEPLTNVNAGEKLTDQAIVSTEVIPFLHITADESEPKLSSLDQIQENVDNRIKLQDSIRCNECSLNKALECFVCSRNESGSEEVVRCNSFQCGKMFHPNCLKYWPQARISRSLKKIDFFRCPAHVCHTCVSDNPKGKFLHISRTKLVRCIKCPATYHMDSTCIPAGSQILTASCIICPRHCEYKPESFINVNWCFICVLGGKLICCETCPTAVHSECLNIPIESEEGYICEECETGRMPLYGEMVWAKFINFRWWPAIILPPTEIPDNIQRKHHNPFEFVVRFFGTNDHGWINRRRVYLYQEGDCSDKNCYKKSKYSS